MSQQFEKLKAQLEAEETFVNAMSLKSSSEFGWDLDPGVIGQVVISVSLVSFTKTVAGKLADKSRDLLVRTLKALVHRLRPQKSREPEPVNVVYSSEINGIQLEVLLHYRDYPCLARDVKNHQQYLSLALGFASAQVKPIDSRVSLLPLLTAQRRNGPSAFILRPSPAG
jgi:hypothetical protein